MRIEVVVSGWEQQCCGKAFRRGETTTVSIVALDPAQTAPDAPARFLEEHHGQTPADVPQWDVTGTVARITGVSYEQRRRPGPHPVFERGDAIASSAELDGVDARETGGYGGLHLLIDLDVDTALPAYVVSDESRAAAERAAREQERAAQLRADSLGRLLDTIADDALAAYSTVATIEQSEEGAAVTIEPLSAEGASISWARSTYAGSDLISVKVGEGQFSLDADVEHAFELREMLAAAAAGRVHEKVRRSEESTEFETVVESADGRTWTASTTYAPLRMGNGVVMMPGVIGSRIQAGDHGYEAWA